MQRFLSVLVSLVVLLTGLVPPAGAVCSYPLRNSASPPPILSLYSQQAVVVPTLAALRPAFKQAKIFAAHQAVLLLPVASLAGAYLPGALHVLAGHFGYSGSGLFFSAAVRLPPAIRKEAVRIESELKAIAYEHLDEENPGASVIINTNWRRLQSLVQREFSGYVRGAVSSRNKKIYGQYVTKRTANAEALSWLHEREDYEMKRLAPLLDIQLDDIGYREEGIELQDAIDAVKAETAGYASQVLLTVANEARDSITIAAAVDALSAIGAHDYLASFAADEPISRRSDAPGRLRVLEREFIQSEVAKPPKKPQRALVVENNAHQKKVIVRQLTQAGFSVWTAESTDRAMQMVKGREREFDLILLNLAIHPQPEYVLSVGRQLKNIHQKARVLYTWGYSLNDAMEQGAIHRTTPYVQWPSENFVEKVQAFLAPASVATPSAAHRPIESIPCYLPIFARFNSPARIKLISDRRVIASMAERFPHLDKEKARYIAAIALQLLSFQPVTYLQADEVLRELVQSPVELWGQDLYVMTAMLAMLGRLDDPNVGTMTFRSLNRRDEDVPPENDTFSVNVLDPARADLLRREITRTRWSGQAEFEEHIDLGDVARRLGSMIHRQANPSITGFMGYMFEALIRETMGGAIPGVLPIDEDYVAVAKQYQGETVSPEYAALAQFSVIARAIPAADELDNPWTRTYRWAARFLSNVYEATDLSGRPLSLSQLGRDLWLMLTGRPISPEHLAASVSISDDDQRWRIFIPEDLVLTMRRKILEPIIRLINRPQQNRKRRQWVNDFWKNYFPTLISPFHMNSVKYIDLLKAEWPQIVELVQGLEPSKKIKLWYLEIHPEERCHNCCSWCKGDETERPVPEEEVGWTPENMEYAIDQAYEINPRMFVRVSGSIGDANYNRDIHRLYRRLNNVTKVDANGRAVPNAPIGLRWGITMDGLGISSKSMAEMVNSPVVSRCEWLQVSLDAVDNKSYFDLKFKRDTGEEYIEGKSPKLFDQVIDNLKWMVEERKRTGSQVKIFVSALVHEDTYERLDELSQLLESIGVDGFQVKFRHFNPNRPRLEHENVVRLYKEVLVTIQRRIRKNHLDYKLMIVQDEEMAHQKNEGVQPLKFMGREDLVAPVVPKVPSPICYSGYFTVTASARGLARTCCQYYQKVLPAFGNIFTAAAQGIGMKEILQGDERKRVLKMNVQGEDGRPGCDGCSPSDEFINRLMYFFSQASAVPGVMDDIKRILDDYWRLEKITFEHGDVPLMMIESIERARNQVIARVDKAGWSALITPVRVVFAGISSALESFLTPLFENFWLARHSEDQREFSAGYLPWLRAASVAGLGIGVFLNLALPSMNVFSALGLSVYVSHFTVHGFINLRQENQRSTLTAA